MQWTAFRWNQRILFWAAVAWLCPCSVSAPQPLFAQAAVSKPADDHATAPVKAPQVDLPAQVGLIDMAYVFKNSSKFLILTEKLQAEIEQTDAQAKALVDKILSDQKQLAQGTLQQSSPEYAQIEERVVRGKAELETFKRTSQQKFMRQEAEIYKTVYLDVEDAVRRYATYYKYTLVLRFDRNEVEQNEDPRQIMNGMNRQVVHYQAQDDMTEPVLKFLNSEWEKQGGAKPSTSLTPTDSSISSGGVKVTR